MTDVVVYRPATTADIEATYDLFRTATEDLLAQRNLALPEPTEAGRARFFAFRRHVLTHDPDRFWVAESARDREMVGFGIATLRDQLWYLAALHVRPGWQGRGIGRELLRCCQESIAARANITRIVISDSLNPHSNLLYARAGMMQSEPLIELTGPTAASESPLAVALIDDAGPLAAFDLDALRATRAQDHAFWLEQPSQSLLSFTTVDGPVGYAYAGATGIGPAVGRDEMALAAVIDAALGWLHARGRTKASLKLPGSARAILAVLLNRGFRYDHILLIGTSAPMPNLDRYAVSVADALF